MITRIFMTMFEFDGRIFFQTKKIMDFQCKLRERINKIKKKDKKEKNGK